MVRAVGRLVHRPMASINWQDANQNCINEGGQLATPWTKADNDAIAALGVGPGVWLGGTDAGHEGVWKWLDGSVFSHGATCNAGAFCNWASGEPNGGTRENHLMMWGKGNSQGFPIGTWNDADTTNSRDMTGYVCHLPPSGHSSFDGASCYSVPSSPSLQSINTTITIEAWVYPLPRDVTADKRQGIAGTWDDVSEDDRTWTLLLDNMKPFFYTTDSATLYPSVAAPNPLPYNQWSHVAATKASDGTATIYVDGIAVATGTLPKTIRINDKPMRVGCAYAGGVSVKFFTGHLDSVRVWSSFRETHTIRNAMNCGTPTVRNGLVAEYTFDDAVLGSGTMSNQAGTNGVGEHTGGVTLNGNTVIITASGTMYCNAFNCPTSPDGSSTPAHSKMLLPGVNQHSLLARVGSGSWQFVGSGPTRISGTGALTFGYNDGAGEYFDNNGQWDIVVSMAPSDSSGNGNSIVASHGTPSAQTQNACVFAPLDFTVAPPPAPPTPSPPTANPITPSSDTLPPALVESGTPSPCLVSDFRQSNLFTCHKQGATRHESSSDGWSFGELTADHSFSPFTYQSDRYTSSGGTGYVDMMSIFPTIFQSPAVRYEVQQDHPSLKHTLTLRKKGTARVEYTRWSNMYRGTLTAGSSPISVRHEVSTGATTFQPTGEFSTDAAYTSGSFQGSPKTQNQAMRYSSAGTRTFTFSPVVNRPVLAISSLGSPAFRSTFVFNHPFQVVSQGTGNWGAGKFTKEGCCTLHGYEFSGVVKFDADSVSSLVIDNTVGEHYVAVNVGSLVGTTDRITLSYANNPPLRQAVLHSGETTTFDVTQPRSSKGEHFTLVVEDLTGGGHGVELDWKVAETCVVPADTTEMTAVVAIAVGGAVGCLAVVGIAIASFRCFRARSRPPQVPQHVAPPPTIVPEPGHQLYLPSTFGQGSAVVSKPVVMASAPPADAMDE